MKKALFARRPDEYRRLASAVHSELLQLGMPRANLLLVGLNSAVRPVVRRLVAPARETVIAWYPGSRLVLPPTDRPATLVLHDVGALPPADQIRLFDWLGSAMGRTQVISTAPVPLLPRIQAGGFLSDLYYRLNVLYVEVNA